MSARSARTPASMPTRASAAGEGARPTFIGVVRSNVVQRFHWIDSRVARRRRFGDCSSKWPGRSCLKLT
jgi:hypothetical protein